MNCIDEQLLQKYIDHECTDMEIKDVKQHLLECEACKKNLDEREKLSTGIKRAVKSMNREDIEIPAFKNVSAGFRNKDKNIKFLLYSLSAACILLWVLFVVDKQIHPNQDEITIVQSIAVEVDANRTASDQQFVIEVYDGKGQRSEYLIE